MWLGKKNTRPRSGIHCTARGGAGNRRTAVGCPPPAVGWPPSCRRYQGKKSKQKYVTPEGKPCSSALRRSAGCTAPAGPVGEAIVLWCRNETLQSSSQPRAETTRSDGVAAWGWPSLYEKTEGVGGSGTQKVVYQRWPRSIFPFANFIFSHHEIWVQAGRGSRGGYHPSSDGCQTF